MEGWYSASICGYVMVIFENCTFTQAVGECDYVFTQGCSNVIFLLKSTQSVWVQVVAVYVEGGKKMDCCEV